MGDGEQRRGVFWPFPPSLLPVSPRPPSPRISTARGSTAASHSAPVLLYTLDNRVWGGCCALRIGCTRWARYDIGHTTPLIKLESSRGR